MNEFERLSNHLLNVQVENDEGYNEYKNELYQKISNTEKVSEKIEILTINLNHLHLHKIECEKNWHKENKPSDRINKVNFELIIVEKLISTIEENLKTLNKILVNNSERHIENNFKLTWNAQSNALIDIFWQCKKDKFTKDGLSYISNTSEEIALFLKNNFECFSDTKISTIKGQLDKKERPSKKNNLLDL